MVWKKRKIKYFYVFLLSLLLVCGLLQSSKLSLNTYASETYTVNDYLTSNNFYDVCAWFCRHMASFPDAYGGGTGFTYENFADYLEEKGKSNILQEPVTVVENSEGSSGGRGYELPTDARQEIINFVNETYIEQNPLGYVGCYIPSYNIMSPEQFNIAQVYFSLKEFMKNQDGYIFVIKDITFNDFRKGYICVVPRINYVDFVGSTTSGIFQTVSLYYMWDQLRYPTFGNIPGSKYYEINSSGEITEVENGSYNWVNLLNNTGFSTSGNYIRVFTSYEKSEYVYVFETLNALKNYNAALPQSYYLLSEGSNIAPSYDPVTSKDLSNAANFYNSIVNNINPGDTPDQVQKTVKNGLLGNLLDTLTGSNSSVSTENGNFDMSFLGTIKDLVLGVTGAIDPAEQLVNTDLRRFVTDIFGWLPGEIVTFWIAGILFAVLFGVLKIIRG